jgi:hypothetical protein
MGTKTSWGGFKFVIKAPRHALLRAFDNELETCLFWLGLLVFAPKSVTYVVRTFTAPPYQKNSKPLREIRAALLVPELASERLPGAPICGIKRPTNQDYGQNQNSFQNADGTEPPD